MEHMKISVCNKTNHLPIKINFGIIGYIYATCLTEFVFNIKLIRLFKETITITRLVTVNRFIGSIQTHNFENNSHTVNNNAASETCLILYVRHQSVRQDPVCLHLCQPSYCERIYMPLGH